MKKKRLTTTFDAFIIYPFPPIFRQAKYEEKWRREEAVSLVSFFEKTSPPFFHEMEMV